MSAHAYTENQFFEQPALWLFAELAWAVARPRPNAAMDQQTPTVFPPCVGCRWR